MGRLLLPSNNSQHLLRLAGPEEKGERRRSSGSRASTTGATRQTGELLWVQRSSRPSHSIAMQGTDEETEVLGRPATQGTVTGAVVGAIPLIVLPSYPLLPPSVPPLRERGNSRPRRGQRQELWGGSAENGRPRRRQGQELL